MKKEKGSVTAATPIQTKGLPINAVNNTKEGAEVCPTPPPTIKSDPDAAAAAVAGGQINPVVNGENSTPGCDNSTPPTPTGGGNGGGNAGGGGTGSVTAGQDGDAGTTGGAGSGGPPPSTQEDKKPPVTPNDCGGVVKSETDSFLDSFDTKDGGETFYYITFSARYCH